MKLHFPRCMFLLGAPLIGCSASWAADGPVEKVTVKAVTRFDFARAAIPPQGQQAILAEVGEMKGVTWQAVVASGHTDSIGPALVNQKLSAQRAQSVKDYLVAKGLDPAMISTEAKAATVPVASNDTVQGRARNRRTEIEFTGVRAAAR